CLFAPAGLAASCSIYVCSRSSDRVYKFLCASQSSTDAAYPRVRSDGCDTALFPCRQDSQPRSFSADQSDLSQSGVASPGDLATLGSDKRADAKRPPYKATSLH